MLYIVINLIVGGIAILTPYLTGDFIDTLVLGKGLKTIYNFCAILAAINIARLLLGYYTSVIYIKMQARMGYDFNKAVITHVQRLSLSFINNSDTAYLNQIINNDTNALIIFCITVVQNFITNLLYLAIPLVISFKINSLITMLLMVFVIIYLFLFIIFKKPLYTVNMRMKEGQSKFFSKLHEQFQLIRFIKIHSVESEFHERLDDSFDHLLEVTMVNQRFSYIYSGLDNIVSLLVQIMLYLVGGVQIYRGHFTIGMFTIFFSYFNMMLGSIRYFFSFGKTYQDTLVSYNRLNNIMEEIEESNGKIEIRDVNLIDTKDLFFSYGNKEVLRSTNLSFQKGSSYAVVGDNGTGKSTLINLLIGLYADERKGLIYYDETSLNKLDMRLIRKNVIGISEQEPILINDSIKYNLHLGIEFDEKADGEQLQRYMELLNMSDFINNLPDGYNTVINERSTNISGGEKQKLSILRVLMKNPYVMVFDEPTSALDERSSRRFIVRRHFIVGINYILSLPYLIPITTNISRDDTVGPAKQQLLVAL